MSKKRRTRKEKIILQLKRQLSQQQSNLITKETNLKISQEEVFIKPKIQSQEIKIVKINEISNLSDNLKFIKKDLFKTIILTFLIISFEFVLYLKLR